MAIETRSRAHLASDSIRKLAAEKKVRQRDEWVQRHPGLRRRIAEANELQPVELTDDEVGDLVAFLRALTDPSSRDLAALVPPRVPSGLPVDDYA